MKISQIVCVLFLAFLIVIVIASCKKASSNPAPTPDLTPDSLKVGLLAYYPFDNNANDISGNGNNGSPFLVTPTTDRHGKANGAYYFDGYNNYVVVPGNTSLGLNNTNFTLSVWVKLNTYTLSNIVNILTRRFVGSNFGWVLGFTGSATNSPGLINFEISGISSSVGDDLIDIYDWHMITVVYDASNQLLTEYLDAKLDRVINDISSPNPPVNSNLYIGRDDPSTQSAESFFNGSIEEVRIYNRMLSPSAIQKLYTF